MFTGSLDTDFNGIVLFDPSALREHYGGGIPEGTDLFTRYVTTDEGDEVLSRGLIVPVLAIDDAGYDIVVRLATEPSGMRGEAVVVNGIYPLRVIDELVVADLLVLREWSDRSDWQPTGIGPGAYGVSMHGFRQIIRHKAGKARIASAGYEFVLDVEHQLPKLSADTACDMQLLQLE